ncbi:MAG: TIR domain-containing protein [Steroidobacteraceae bacterium]
MIFTFYSYKGGVGRSMAMASVANLLAQQGLRVLAMDFDLEAPGIERYFFEGERCRSVRTHPGFMDLIRAYREALSSQAAFDAGEFQHWRNFRLTAINVASTRGGSVDLMTAGKREPDAANRDYALAVRTFDWNDFFYHWKGDLFFDWLRRQLTNSQTGYDVVLVDTRTGVTEMGGVCAYQLADAAVLLCAPNYQNLDGTVDVVQDFRSESVRALRRGRPLEILALPARLEASHPGRAGFLQLFKQRLGVDGLPAVLARAGLDYEKLALPYLPQFAVAEQLVGDAQQQKGGLVPVADAFERLADALTLLAQPDTPLGRLQGEALERLMGGGSEATSELVADTTKSSAGYDAFIDYCEADLPLVQELTRSLERQGQRIFLDAHRLQGGQNWQLAMEEALAYSSALLVCFGQPTDNERRARTLAQARRLQTLKIIPVLLPGADERVLASFDLGVQQAIDLRNWNDTAARERLMTLVQSAARPASRPSTTTAPTQRDPYPGMRAFREDDASFFFGRESETEEVLEALADNDVVLITGAAQIGKTSLVQAGLLPRLRQFEKGHALHFETIHCQEPGQDLTSARDDSGASALLVIDHIDSFEDDGSERARRARLQWLREALDTASASRRLILVGRDACDDERVVDLFGLPGRPRTRHIVLQPFNREALTRAIEEPARRAAHLLEPGLAERLIESAGAVHSAVAQVQEALATIWPERKRGWLTNTSLDTAGHLGGIVTRRHLDVLGQFKPQERAAACVLFGRLVGLSTSYAIVPAPQPWRIVSTLPALAEVDAVALRDRLARSGVIDLFRAEALEFGKGSSETMIALTRPNPSPYLELDGAQPDMRFLLWRDPTYAQAVRWKAGADTLLRGSALVEAEECLTIHERELTEWERAFITVSREAREQELARERQRQAAELAVREERERERREAAERLAAEQGVRLKLEQASSARLRRGRLWLLGLLVVSAVLAAAASTMFMQARESAASARKSERLARDEAQRAGAEAQKARAEKQSTDILLANTIQARDSLQVALASANQARIATENALKTQTAQSREYAETQLATAEQNIDKAQTSVANLGRGCPVGQRFYLHVANEYDRDSARRLIPVLEKEGFIVPGIEVVPRASSLSEVRFFKKEEEPTALKVAMILEKLGVRRVKPVFTPAYEKSKNVRPCHYEVWFSADAFARAASK